MPARVRSGANSTDVSQVSSPSNIGSPRRLGAGSLQASTPPSRKRSGAAINSDSKISIPTTVIGDWPKPVYLRVPDCHRAAQEGRLYIVAELNDFIQKLKDDAKDEFHQKKVSSHAETHVVKQRCFELPPDFYPICILPESYAERYCEKIRFKPGSRSRASSSSRSRESNSQRKSPSLDSPRSSRMGMRQTIAIPPFVVTASGKNEPLYRDHHSGKGDVPIHSFTPPLDTNKVMQAASSQIQKLKAANGSASATQSTNMAPATAVRLGRQRSRSADLQGGPVKEEKELHSLPGSRTHLASPSWNKRWTPHQPAEFSFRSFRHPTYFEEAYMSALHHTINEQVNCGVAISTDGFLLRENSVYHFCRHIRGIDFTNLSYRIHRAGAAQTYVPTIVNKLEVEVPGFLAEEWVIAQKLSAVPVKACVPGPYTTLHMLSISKRAYQNSASTAFTDLVTIIAREIALLYNQGCRHVQVDEPFLTHVAATVSPTEAITMVKKVAKCIEKVASYVGGATDTDKPLLMRTYIHLCTGPPPHLNHTNIAKADNVVLSLLVEAVDKSSFHAICLEDVPQLDLRMLLLVKRSVVVLGLADSYDITVEPVDLLRRRVLEALLYVPANRLMISPSCGLGYLPQGLASRKLLNLVMAGSRVNAPSYNFYSSVSIGLPKSSKIGLSRHAHKSAVSKGSMLGRKKYGSISRLSKLKLKESRDQWVVQFEGRASSSHRLVRDRSYNVAPVNSKVSHLGVHGSVSIHSVNQLQGTVSEPANTNYVASSVERGVYVRTVKPLVAKDLMEQFWKSNNIPEERGGLQQMLISLTERLLTVTRRTNHTLTHKFDKSAFTRGLWRWRKLSLANKQLVEKALYDLSIGPNDLYRHYDAINKSSTDVEVPENSDCSRIAGRRTCRWTVPFKASQFYAKCKDLLEKERQTEMAAERQERLEKWFGSTNQPPPSPGQGWKFVKYGQLKTGRKNESVDRKESSSLLNRSSVDLVGKLKKKGLRKGNKSSHMTEFKQGERSGSKARLTLTPDTLSPRRSKDRTRGEAVPVQLQTISAAQLEEAITKLSQTNMFAKDFSSSPAHRPSGESDNFTPRFKTPVMNDLDTVESDPSLSSSVSMAYKVTRSKSTAASKTNSTAKVTFRSTALAVSLMIPKKIETTSVTIKHLPGFSIESPPHSLLNLASDPASLPPLPAISEDGLPLTTASHSLHRKLAALPPIVRREGRRVSMQRADDSNVPKSRMSGRISRLQYSRLSKVKDSKVTFGASRVGVSGLKVKGGRPTHPSTIMERERPCTDVDELLGATASGKCTGAGGRRGTLTSMQTAMTIVQVRGERVMFKDVMASPKSMERLMEEHCYSIPSDLHSPTSVQAVYSMMNPHSSTKVDVKDSSSADVAEKAALLEASKQKKIIEFQAYKHNKRGKAVTQKVIIRKSTHKVVERSEEKVVRSDEVERNGWRNARRLTMRFLNNNKKGLMGENSRGHIVDATPSRELAQGRQLLRPTNKTRSKSGQRLSKKSHSHVLDKSAHSFTSGFNLRDTVEKAWSTSKSHQRSFRGFKSAGKLPKLSRSHLSINSLTSPTGLPASPFRSQSSEKSFSGGANSRGRKTL